MTDMEETFDYGKALGELEAIALKVEDPATSLDDMDGLLKRSSELTALCREYLTGVRERLQDKEEER